MVACPMPTAHPCCPQKGHTDVVAIKPVPASQESTNVLIARNCLPIHPNIVRKLEAIFFMMIPI